MKPNVGGVERVVRILVGLALLALGLLHVVGGTLAVVAYLTGAVAVITGLIRFCPAWSFFGINTCEASRKPAK